MQGNNAFFVINDEINIFQSEIFSVEK